MEWRRRDTASPVDPHSSPEKPAGRSDLANSWRSSGANTAPRQDNRWTDRTGSSHGANTAPGQDNRWTDRAGSSRGATSSSSSIPHDSTQENELLVLALKELATGGRHPRGRHHLQGGELAELQRTCTQILHLLDKQIALCQQLRSTTRGSPDGVGPQAERTSTADAPKLPFTSLQLSRISLSLARLCNSQPQLTSGLCHKLCTAAVAQSSHEQIALSTWCSLLYGLVGAGYSGPPLTQVMDVGVASVTVQLTAGAKLLARQPFNPQELSPNEKITHREINPRYFPQNIAKLLWALAKAEYPNHPATTELLCTVSDVVCFDGKTLMAQASAFDWTQVLWAGTRLAGMRQGSMPGVAKTKPNSAILSLLEEAMSRMTHAIDRQEAAAQDISNSLWAAATCVTAWGYGGGLNKAIVRPLVTAAAHAFAQGAFRRAACQEWTNATWAFGKLEQECDVGPIVLGVAEDAFLHIAQELTSQGLGNMLWGLAHLGCADTVVLHKAVKLLPSSLRHATAQEISNCFWALGRTMAHSTSRYMWGRVEGRVDRYTLSSLVDVVRQRLAGGSLPPGALPQNYANVLWGLATLDAYDEFVFSTCLKQLATFSHPHGSHPLQPVDVSISMWAAACCCHFNDPAIVHLIRSVDLGKLQAYHSHQLANALYAWAVLFSRQRGPDASQSLVPGSTSSTTHHHDALVQTPPVVHSAEQLRDLDDADAFATAVFTEVANRDVEEFTEAGLTQLAQAHIEALQTGLACGGMPDGAVKDKAMSTWLSRRDVTTKSGFQGEVGRVLTQMGWQIEEEFVTSTRMHRVDVLVTCKPDGQDCYVMLECDGPYHVLQLPPTRLTGASVLRHRQLRRYAPLAIMPLAHWTYLKAEQRQQYVDAVVRQALARGVNTLPDAVEYESLTSVLSTDWSTFQPGEARLAALPTSG